MRVERLLRAVLGEIADYLVLVCLPPGARSRLLSLFAVAAATGASGCAECEVGEASCDGNVAVNCESVEGEPSVSEYTCEAPRSCVVSSERALCVLGKSPACPSSGVAACEGSDQLTCFGEWVTARFPCQTCEPAREEPCERGAGATCTTDADCLDGYICFGFLDEKRICGHRCDPAVCEGCSIAELPGETQRACF